MKAALSLTFVAVLCLSLPIANFVLIVRMVYDFAVPDLLSPFLSTALGCVIGVCSWILLFCLVGFNGQLLMTELIVPSFVLLMLLLLLAPVANRLSHNRRAGALKEQRARTLHRTIGH